MYENLLVPLDGSEVAERALPYVEELARRMHSEVILLTACAPVDRPERLLRAYLEKRVREFHSLGLHASAVVVHGNAADAILDFAEQNNLDMIVISTHGRTGVSRWVMGSVSSKILQKTHVPALLVRSGVLEVTNVERKLRKILVPLDGSRFAEYVVPYVQALCLGMESEPVLLKVVEPVKIPHIRAFDEGFHLAKLESELLAKAEEEAVHYLGNKKHALMSGGVRTTSLCLVGESCPTILQYAEEHAIDLIVVASHGFSGITKWAYGSITSKIIEQSQLPVMVIRPRL